MPRVANITPKISALRWLSLPLLLTACGAFAAPTEYVYVGEARDNKGRLVYIEKHRIVSSDGRLTGSVTEYTAPDGNLIAVMQSDYSRSVALPTYIFEDRRRNHREGLRWQDGAYVIFRQDGNTPEKSSRLASDSGVFSCQGWHYHLIENLNLLERDNLTLNLVLPSQLRAFPFEVKKLVSDQSIVSAELSIKHWLFRYFAPSMLMEYDKQKRRLLAYHGVSNILTKAGDRQEVTIRYTYPGE